MKQIFAWQTQDVGNSVDKIASFKDKKQNVMVCSMNCKALGGGLLHNCSWGLACGMTTNLAGECFLYQFCRRQKYQRIVIKGEKLIYQHHFGDSVDDDQKGMRLNRGQEIC